LRDLDDIIPGDIGEKGRDDVLIVCPHSSVNYGAFLEDPESICTVNAVPSNKVSGVVSGKDPVLISSSPYAGILLNKETICTLSVLEPCYIEHLGYVIGSNLEL
jgi:hypothetical protein